MSAWALVRVAAQRPISGSNFSATGCSAWWSRQCSMKPSRRRPEGELSRRLADLVRQESCAEVAAAWGVGAHVRLGSGEAQSGGARKTAILADVCESLVGAIFLDAGYGAARDGVARAWREGMLAPRRPLQDAKTALQEWAQARGRPPPLYREIGRSG